MPNSAETGYRPDYSHRRSSSIILTDQQKKQDQETRSLLSNWNNITKKQPAPETTSIIIETPPEPFLEQPQSEVATSVEVASPEQKEESIFESYAVENDPKMLQRMIKKAHETGANAKQIEEMIYAYDNVYLRANLLSYFEEFVAKIPEKSIHGVIKNDGTFEIMGMDMREMYVKTAEMAGQDSREWHEMEGLDKVYEALKTNNRAVWFSSSKLADYGFMMVFMKGEYDEKLGGYPIEERLLRYDEKLGEVGPTREMYKSVVDKFGLQAPNSDNFNDYKGFLQSPLTYNHDGIEDINFLLKIAKLDETSAQRSQEFEKDIFPQLKPLVDRYRQVVMKMVDFDLDDAADSELLTLKKEAELLVGAMFNASKLALEMKKKGDTKNGALLLVPQLSDESTDKEKMEFYAMAQQLAGREKLVITGGSNCTVARSDGQTERLTRNSFAGLVSSGAIGTHDALQLLGLNNTDYKDDPNLCRCGKANGPHFHCPGGDGKECGHPIVVGKGISTCPKCGAGKKC